jgi:hypothetical protein
VEDVRARMNKLSEDVDRLRFASADDWWDVKARVTEYLSTASKSPSLAWTTQRLTRRRQRALLPFVGTWWWGCLRRSCCWRQESG